MSTYTVEALTCASDVIVVGELTDFSGKKAPSRGIGLEVCSIRVTEVLKGSTAAYFLKSWRDQSWHNKGRGVLAFLRQADKQDDEHLRRQLIPTQQDDEVSIVDLVSLRPVFTNAPGAG